MGAGEGEQRGRRERGDQRRGERVPSQGQDQNGDEDSVLEGQEDPEHRGQVAEPLFVDHVIDVVGHDEQEQHRQRRRERCPEAFDAAGLVGHEAAAERTRAGAGGL
jgi:hypothetical protein